MNNVAGILKYSSGSEPSHHIPTMTQLAHASMHTQNNRSVIFSILCITQYRQLGFVGFMIYIMLRMG